MIETRNCAVIRIGEYFLLIKQTSFEKMCCKSMFSGSRNLRLKISKYKNQSYFLTINHLYIKNNYANIEKLSPTLPIYFPLKIKKDLRFSDVFKVYKKGKLTWNRLKCT